ncbi:hypothetical protein SBA3_3920007 [Candidatus Sulfopaludibacter sp. SbA3]|nr:hypothetical protein SBA3_3920007 [Candidatus Sulfopaludibacter sp. SbA3]
MQTKKIESLLLSVPQMDDDHTALITQEDEFSTAVAADAPRAELFVRLTQLIEAFRYHFDCEESMMRSNRFKSWKRHAQEHLTLIEQMSWLRDDLAAGTVNQCGAMVLCMRDWTEQHIIGADKRFACYLHEGPVANGIFSIVG